METRFVEATEYNEQELKAQCKEMSNFEIWGIEYYVTEWFAEQGVYNIGLETVYSSHGTPLLNVMEDIRYNEMQLSHFHLIGNETLVMVLSDDEDNYKYYYIK